MTTIERRAGEDLYQGDTLVGRVSVEIEADVIRSPFDEDHLWASARVSEAVSEELQAIQDELDEEGEVSLE